MNSQNNTVLLILLLHSHIITLSPKNTKFVSLPKFLASMWVGGHGFSTCTGNEIFDLNVRLHQNWKITYSQNAYLFCAPCMVKD